MACPYCYYATTINRSCLALYYDNTGNKYVDGKHFSKYCLYNDANNSKKCRYWATARRHSQEDFQSQGFCYITTAVCNAENKPDDCYELTQFRSFRDNWLVNQPDGKDLISEYYENAPRIVEEISKLENAEEIYEMIKNEYLSKCLEYIENGENEKCKEVYTAMMHKLYEMETQW